MDPVRLVPPVGAGRARRPLTAALTCLLTALLSAALLGAADPDGGWWSPGRDQIHPALPADAASRPLAVPEPAPEGTGGYRVLEVQDDGSARPVRWDPCRPIHYVIRPDHAPAGGAVAIRTAIVEVERLTGLRFAFDGYTREVPRRDRPTIDVPRYGDRWSPVLLAWTDPREYPAMKGYAGLGGPDSVDGRSPGRSRYVTGVVLLNREHLDQVVGWDHGQERLAAVVLHEFGHLIGLDHVEDPEQLMYRQPTARATGFADGDRRGLARLASGPCFRDF